MLTREALLAWPKVELHVHLDGSLRPATMLELAERSGADLPTRDPAELERFMLVDDARDLEQYLARFEYTIGLLQTQEAIARVAYELAADLHAENVRYAEIRYCPRLSTRGGLSMDAALEAELDGLRLAERDFGIVTRVINCSLRHYAPEVSREIAEATVRWRDRGVVAFDLAGGEAGRPPELHAEAFDVARRAGLGITVHAGEAAGAESIFEAVHRCGANRIGHGTRLFEDPRLEAYLRDRRICLEACITSNVQTHAVRSVAEHPIRRYLDHDLPVTICTDNRLMSGVSVTDELWLAHQQLNLTDEELARTILDGLASAFLPWPDRADLLARVTDELDTLA